MLAGAVLCGNCYVKCSACRDSAAYSRHDNGGYVIKRNVCCRFRNEHETLIKTIQVAFVCFDAALDPGLLVMTINTVSLLSMDCKAYET